MDENISLAVVRHNEAVPFDGVEPFDPPSDFDQIHRPFVAFCYTRRRFRRLDKFLAQFVPHSTRRPHILAAYEPLTRRDWDHPRGPAKKGEHPQRK